MNGVPTLADMVRVLEQNILSLDEKDRGFALSLISAHKKWNNLSSKQSYWVGRLVAKATEVDEDEQPKALGQQLVEDNKIDGSQLIAHFDHAHAAGIEYPQLTLDTQLLKSGRLQAYRTGVKSVKEGCVIFTDGHKYPDGIVLCKVERDGAVKFSTASFRLLEVTELIKSVIATPVETLAAYGKRTFHCCFCALPLKHASSVFHGYGPICAEKWSLPWGETEKSVTSLDIGLE